MLDMPSNQSYTAELRPVKGHEAAGDNGKPDGSKLSVLNVEIHGSAWVQFFVCVSGVFACGVTHDFVQEYVFRYDAFDFGWFMTLWSAPFSVTCAPSMQRPAVWCLQYRARRARLLLIPTTLKKGCNAGNS